MKDFPPKQACLEVRDRRIDPSILHADVRRVTKEEQHRREHTDAEREQEQSHGAMAVQESAAGDSSLHFHSSLRFRFDRSFAENGGRAEAEEICRTGEAEEGTVF
jgi:hypothetical protein